jgi:hypothetical protein
MHLRTPIIAFALLAAFVFPHDASAASRPSCSLTVTTPRGEATTKKSMDILAMKGETLELSWESKNAKTARDADRDEIELEDSVRVKADRNETFSYTFMSGSRKAVCSVSVRIAEADFAGSTLATSDTTPSLTGSAEGVKSVRLLVETAAGKKVALGKESKVKSGEWKATVTKKLKEGKYVVSILGPKSYDLPVLATTTLEVTGKDGAASGGTLSVSQLPLLTGGVAANGASVPVAYVQMRNTGKTAVSIAGIRLKENGSAPDEAVVGFAVNDDKGGSRATHSLSLKNGIATVPLAYTLLPGELRIFTVKASISPAKRLYNNAELKIDIAGIDTGAKVTAAFPIRGTTWILR